MAYEREDGALHTPANLQFFQQVLVSEFEIDNVLSWIVCIVEASNCILQEIISFVFLQLLLKLHQEDSEFNGNVLPRSFVKRTTEGNIPLV
jgi:hypothetical protein